MSTVSGSDSVFGHYIQQANTWEPLLSESSALFRAVVEDDAGNVEAQIGADASRVNAFYVLLYWGSQAQNGRDKEETSGEGSMKPAVTVKQRTLLMIAAFHGSMRVLSMLAVNGADPALVSPDGMTAYELAYSGNHPSTPTIVAYLRDAENSLQVLRGQVDVSKAPLAQLPTSGSVGIDGVPGGGMAMQQDHYRGGVWSMPLARQDSGPDPFNPDALPYSTTELTKPEYSTDDFRMFCFKVLRCCRRYAHDWRACPFAHPTENARRRDPREYRYCSIACPDYKQGFCIRGDGCPYAHGVFECWLHPSRYRSQLCKDGNKCRRPVCFFAHSLPELRTPSHTWVPSAEVGQSPAVTPSSLAPASTNPAITSHINLSPVTTSAPVSVAAPTQVHTPPHRSVSAPASSALNQHVSGIPGETRADGEQQAGEGAAGPAAPRMSNAFARKHGLNPKDNPMVNLQKMALAGHIVPPAQGPGAKVNPAATVLPILPSETTAPMMKGANRQRKLLKQANQATLEALAMSMNNISLSASSSQGSPGEGRAISHPSDGSTNSHGIYQEQTASMHSDVVPMSHPQVVPGSTAAVSQRPAGQYMSNGAHNYIVGSPGAPGYVHLAAAGHPATPTALVGQPGGLGLHQGQ